MLPNGADTSAHCPYGKATFPYATSVHRIDFPYGKHASRILRKCGGIHTGESSTGPIWAKNVNILFRAPKTGPIEAKNTKKLKKTMILINILFLDDF